MIRSLGFLGVRTAAFAEMAALYRDAFGLEAILDRPGAAWFRAADGTQIHVDAADDAGTAWNHDRGPDGNVYEIIGPDRSAA